MEDKKIEASKKSKKLRIKPKKAKIQHSEDYFLIQSVHMDVLIKKRTVDKNHERIEVKEQNESNSDKLP